MTVSQKILAVCLGIGGAAVATFFVVNSTPAEASGSVVYIESLEGVSNPRLYVIDANGSTINYGEVKEGMAVTVTQDLATHSLKLVHANYNSTACSAPPIAGVAAAEVWLFANVNGTSLGCQASTEKSSSQLNVYAQGTNGEVLIVEGYLDDESESTGSVSYTLQNSWSQPKGYNPELLVDRTDFIKIKFDDEYCSFESGTDYIPFKTPVNVVVDLLSDDDKACLIFTSQVKVAFNELTFHENTDAALTYYFDPYNEHGCYDSNWGVSGSIRSYKEDGLNSYAVNRATGGGCQNIDLMVALGRGNVGSPGEDLNYHLHCTTKKGSYEEEYLVINSDVDAISLEGYVSVDPVDSSSSYCIINFPE